MELARDYCTFSASGYRPLISLDLAWRWHMLFLRYGRYSYDIVDVLENSGSLADCDKSAVSEVASITRE